MGDKGEKVICRIVMECDRSRLHGNAVLTIRVSIFIFINACISLLSYSRKSLPALLYPAIKTIVLPLLDATCTCLYYYPKSTHTLLHPNKTPDSSLSFCNSTRLCIHVGVAIASNSNLSVLLLADTLF